jgi:hypothetical protein
VRPPHVQAQPHDTCCCCCHNEGRCSLLICLSGPQQQLIFIIEHCEITHYFFTQSLRVHPSPSELILLLLLLLLLLPSPSFCAVLSR